MREFFEDLELKAWAVLTAAAIATVMILVASCVSGCSRRPPEAPEEADPISAAQVAVTARKAFGDDALLVDSTYQPVPPDWVKAVLQPRIRQEMPPFKDGITDCDDFARAAAHLAAKFYRDDWHDYPPAYGQVVVISYETLEKHAQNWFLDSAGNVWFHEPQTGRVWLPDNKETTEMIWATM